MITHSHIMGLKHTASGIITRLIIILAITTAAANCAEARHSQQFLQITLDLNHILAIVCGLTVYPDACVHELSSFAINPLTATPLTLVSLSAQAALSRANDAKTLATNLAKNSALSTLEAQSSRDCADLTADAADRINIATSKLAEAHDFEDLLQNGFLRDVKVWLSESLSLQSACLESFYENSQYGDSDAQHQIQSSQDYLFQVIGNAMAFVDVLSSTGNDIVKWLGGSGALPPISPIIHLRRRLLSSDRAGITFPHQETVQNRLPWAAFPTLKTGQNRLASDSSPAQKSSVDRNGRKSTLLPNRASVDATSLLTDFPERETFVDTAHSTLSTDFPDWVSPVQRRLLQAPVSSSDADAVVAQDGSGDFLNMTAALEAIPAGYNGKERYVIYIKQGIYDEVFNVTRDMANLTFLGDGMGVTVITGNRNVSSGLYNTYRTATVGIAGSGFFARDITFKNTAGASGHQAVALRAAADMLVFYHCSFEGYQDTLYALSSRQFYRECKIYGTIDFIFGNAIAIFQSCELIARLPMQGQQNTYTAQGRKLPVDISGFSFQNCNITGDSDLLNNPPYNVSTFLGRPWKAYSRVVIMESQMDTLVEPLGWLPWNESNPFEDTLYFGEYQNWGPGSNTIARVQWLGVHPNMTSDEATQFTVNNFIAGASWIDSSQVQYQLGLS